MKTLSKIYKKVVNVINNINSKYDELYQKKGFNLVLQFFPRNLFLLIFFIVLFCMFVPKVINNDMMQYRTSDFTGYQDPIVSNSVSQKIDLSEVAQLDKIGIVFGTYKRSNDSTYRLDVLENDKVISSQTFNAKKLVDNQLEYFDVHIKHIDPKKEYKFVLTPVKVKNENRAITVAMNDNEIYHYIVKKSEFYDEMLILSSIFLIAFFTVNYLINNNKIKNERIFYLLMLIYIIPTIFIYPAFEVPDETIHFAKAFRLSQYNIKKTPYENMVTAKTTVPNNYECLSYSKWKMAESNNITKDDYLKCFVSAKNKMVKLDSVAPDRFLGYMASAIGIKLADIFTNSPMVLFYAGRLINCLLAFFIIWYALKIIPKHKRLLLMVVLIPVFIQQMISYSYDSLLNAICILITAYLIKFYSSSDKITNKELIILTICSIVVLNIKEPYILLCLPLLFLDKNKFGDGKHDKMKKMLTIMTVIIGAYLGIKYLDNIGPTYQGIIKPGRGNTLASLVLHPKHLLKVIVYTLWKTGVFCLQTMIGGLACLTKYLDVRLIWSYYIFMVLVTMAENSNIKAKDRVISLLSIFIIVCGIFLVMYLSWTPTGSMVIQGVQGRYFLPVLLLLLTMIVPRISKIKIKNETVYHFLNIIMVCFVVTLLVVLY